MADQIRMDFDQLAQVAQRLYTLGNRLNGIGSEIRGVHIDAESGGELKAGVSCYLSGVGYAVNSSDIAGALGQLARAAGRVGDRAAALSVGVSRTAELFASVERELMQTLDHSDGGQWQESGAASENDISQMIVGFFSDTREDSRKPSKSDLQRLLEKSGLPKKLIPTVLATSGGLSLFYSPNHNGSDEIGSSWKPSGFKSKMPEWGQQTDYIRDLKDGNIYLNDGKRPYDYRDKITLLDFGKTYGKSGSVLHGEVHGECYDADIDLLSGEAHVGFKGGIYSYKVGADGETCRTISPGIEVEAGGSFSVLTTSVTSTYELIDGIPLTTDVEASALSGEAKLDAGLGIVDGKFMASIEGKAEFDVVSVEGNAEVDLFGLKGSLGGEVKVGFGGHANFGYRDGKLKVDMGAALGVGASVKFELDMNSFANKVSDFGESVSSGVSKMIDSLF